MKAAVTWGGGQPGMRVPLVILAVSNDNHSLKVVATSY